MKRVVVAVGIGVALPVAACGESDVSAAEIVDSLGDLDPAACFEDGTAAVTAYDRDYVEPTAAEGAFGVNCTTTTS